MSHEGTIGELLHTARLIGAKESLVDLRYSIRKLRIQKKRAVDIISSCRICEGVFDLLQCYLGLLGLGSPVVLGPEEAGPFTSLLNFTVEVKLLQKVFGVPFWTYWSVSGWQWWSSWGGA